MKLRISHQIAYAYDRPVFLEPMRVRLRPRCDHTQELLHYDLRISPEPAGRTAAIDAVDNDVEVVWFDGMRQQLMIETECMVRTGRCNPFDYLVTDPDSLTLPVRYPGDLTSLLAPYLGAAGESGGAPLVSLVELLTRRADGKTLDFLLAAVAHLSASWEHVEREDGPAWSPTSTLEANHATCRDLAMLMVAVCRNVGLAARFVSGYHHYPGVEHPDNRQLHAWVEVYLPGAGWRGYDPTYGLAVADEHIPVAAAPTAEGAAPTTGSFRGTGALAEMTFQVTVTELAD